MGIEIERKFRAANDGWRALADPARATRIAQGYLSRDPERIVRVRLETPIASDAADVGRGTLTIKGLNRGATRPEYEYPIPAADARELLGLCSGHAIAKVRWRIDAGAQAVFEIDVFESPHAGLVLVEIELARENQDFVRPPWLGAEVTGDPRYTNAALAVSASPPA